MTRLATIDRDKVLDSAEALIADQGPTALTLDALAAHTGVSKGGLQYAFKSKEGLIEAMIQRVMEHSEISLRRACEAPTIERRLAMWLDSLANYRSTSFHMALLAALVQNPKLLDRVAAMYRAQIKAMAGDVLPPERVMALSLAADGLILGELLGFVRLSPAERKRVVKEIIAMARCASAL